MEDYKQYSKDLLVDCLSSLDQPIKSIKEVPVRLCEALSCENCPVKLLNCDTRTREEKTLSHCSCQGELYKWLLREAKLIKLTED